MYIYACRNILSIPSVVSVFTRKTFKRKTRVEYNRRELLFRNSNVPSLAIPTSLLRFYEKYSKTEKKKLQMSIFVVSFRNRGITGLCYQQLHFQHHGNSRSLFKPCTKHHSNQLKTINRYLESSSQVAFRSRATPTIPHPFERETLTCILALTHNRRQRPFYLPHQFSTHPQFHPPTLEIPRFSLTRVCLTVQSLSYYPKIGKYRAELARL